MADSIAIVDCIIGVVRPKVPGLKMMCLLEDDLVGDASRMCASLVVERSLFVGGDLDLGRGVLLRRSMMELEEVVTSGVSLLVACCPKPQVKRRVWGMGTEGSGEDMDSESSCSGSERPSPLSRGPW